MELKRKIKHKINRNSFLFKFLKFKYKIFLEPFIKLLEKRKLKKFNKPIFKNFLVKGHKFKLLLDPSNGETDKNSYLNDIYDRNTTEILLNYLNIDSTFLDIGANIGYFTNLGASICRKGKVFAFEPIKRIYNQNIKSIRKNKFGNVKIYNKGCGMKKEEKTIFLDKGNLGASTLLKKVSTQNKIAKEKIEIVKIDDIIKKRVDLIKMDIEGFEYFAFNGMRQLIKKCRPKIVFEFSPYYYENIKKGLSLKFLNELKKMGYSLKDIEDNQKINNFKKYLCKFKGNQSHSNIFCF